MDKTLGRIKERMNEWRITVPSNGFEVPASRETRNLNDSVSIHGSLPKHLQL